MSKKIEELTARINHFREQRKTLPGADLEQVIRDLEAERARVIYLEDAAEQHAAAVTAGTWCECDACQCWGQGAHENDYDPAEI
jgi:hypothetical protein